jgi:dTDP-4-amino-4,6-dideoxygalactose transaminase
MHEQPVFRDAPARTDGTSSHLFAHGLCLPSGSVLGEDDVDRVIDGVLAAIRSPR